MTSNLAFTGDHSKDTTIRFFNINGQLIYDKVSRNVIYSSINNASVEQGVYTVFTIQLTKTP